MSWQPDAPRFPLLDGPSPLQVLPRFGRALGEIGGAAGPWDDPAIWIKREDLLPLAFGGNKLRNLEFLVGAALAEGADVLVTSGRRWSNHCRLTAAAAARAGLECHLVLTGPPPAAPGPGQVLDELLGAHLHFSPTDDRADRQGLIGRVVGALREGGRRPYLIGVGGSGVTGAIGQLLAALELAEQLTARAVTPDLLVVPTATGGTQAGLLVGLRLAGLATRVLGVAVAGPAAELAPVVEGMVRGLADLTLVAARSAEERAIDWAAEIEIDDRLTGEGYGRRSPAADEATRLLARTEGILVDPIYTAKALAELIAEARAGRLNGRTVVFWHAGGLPGLFEPLED